ncbi:unnamed protein product [Phytophthora fragariaefolia]|uniref:Unnamed protein product n=1 Tax=Phytophthora fragariaefolia TaxID=1490495 RepID=A0A9W7D681_9STRA|nr:unnamed protein product [Phytophthora fragariaefolia]
MKGTRMPQNSWCEPFSLSLGRAAKSWYRQLPKKPQQRWSLLSEAFLDYYCSQFDQSARTRYYSARRKEKEPICAFLIRLNGYARTAKIQYEKGGADATNHLEQFLLNCGDDGIMDLLYSLQPADIQRVEKNINKKTFGEKRKKQRGRLVASRVGEGRRSDGPQRRDLSRRGDIRRDHRDGRRGETHESRREAAREPRRDDRRSRRDDNRERRVTVADATVDDLYRGGAPRQLSRRSHSRDSSSSASAYGVGGDSGSDSDYSWNYVDAGAVSDRSAGNSDSATGRRDSRDNRPARRDYRSERQRPDHRDRRDDNRERRPYDRRERRGDSAERPRCGPCAACGSSWHSAHFCNRRCKFCQQVHDAGRCEMFQRLETLTKFVCTSVDKSAVPADLHDIYEPRDLNSAARQH